MNTRRSKPRAQKPMLGPKIALQVWQACLARAGGGSALARSASAWLLDVLTGGV